jgi:transcriptional regulator with XRE-family HTH domain
MERYNDGELAALEQIGLAIRRVRLSLGWTQRMLGDRCGLSQSSISRIEAGLAPTLRLSRLARGSGSGSTRLARPRFNRPRSA